MTQKYIYQIRSGKKFPEKCKFKAWQEEYASINKGKN